MTTVNIAANRGYLQHLALARAWAIKNMQGWDDACHRDLISRHGAGATAALPTRPSASTMTVQQIQSALADYKQRGWGGLVHKKKRTPIQIAHIVRLWGLLAKAGKLHTPTREGLLAHVSKQTGSTVLMLDSLTPTQAQKIIEGLRAWQERGV